MASRQLTQTAIFAAPVSAVFLAGYSFAFSQNAVTQLTDKPPQTSTPIFKRVFEAGANIIIPGVVLSASASAYLWYISNVVQQQRLYLFATVAALAPLPYTGLWMMPGIKRLIQISEDKELQAKAEQTLEARQLLNAWIAQNYLRTLGYVSAGAAGLWASTLW